jgi:hypothetical protein
MIDPKQHVIVSQPKHAITMLFVLFVLFVLFETSDAGVKANTVAVRGDDARLPHQKIPTRHRGMRRHSGRHGFAMLHGRREWSRASR